MQAGKLISKYITATIGIITVIVAAINCNDMFCLKKNYIEYVHKVTNYSKLVELL